MERIKNAFFVIIFHVTRKIKRNPTIYSIEETVQKLLKDKVSMSRFGDGELKWMCGLRQDSFQDNSKLLKKRLREVIVSDESNHIVCLSDVFNDLSQYTPEAKKWWKVFMGKYRFIWLFFLKPGKKYFNTNITRPYMDYNEKDIAAKRFELIKSIWSGRNIVIVEGEKTKLGSGNDLLNKADSVKRIICPPKNAFSKYDTILKSVNEIANKDDLILIALGPTATILAYDLAKAGYQALDIGHVDIEYEWYLMKAESKVAIKGRYVNEIKEELAEENQDFSYLSSIKKVIS